MLFSKFCFSPQELAQSLDCLRDVSALSMPCLSPLQVQQLIGHLPELTYRSARPVVGKGENKVYQDFRLCMDFAPDDPFRQLGQKLEQQFQMALSIMDAAPLSLNFKLNDLIVQIYEPGGQGMSAHRDHIRYQGLVVLLLLEGESHFFTCADRQHSDPVAIPAQAGDMILMPAPGFADTQRRPFHFVTSPTQRRVSFGLRFDSQAEEVAE